MLEQFYLPFQSKTAILKFFSEPSYLPDSVETNCDKTFQNTQFLVSVSLFLFDLQILQN